MHFSSSTPIVIVLVVTYFAVISKALGVGYTVVPHWNAIPHGPSEDIKTQQGCESHCAATAGCTQWTWNYGHAPKYYCFISNSSTWGGLYSNHITSGCVPSQVQGCGVKPPGPPNTIEWKVTGAPESSKPFCGFEMLNSEQVTLTTVYKATEEIGAYNHAAMMDWYNDTMLLTWKNSPRDEDSPGQRVLYSMSKDGATWTPTDGKNVMFPGITAQIDGRNTSLFAGPTAILNGRRYATASPHQFCLFPYPYSSNVTASEPTNLLMMRRVSGGIPPTLGPIFWASNTTPSGFEAASAAFGIIPSFMVDYTTYTDLMRLNDISDPPCADPKTQNTLKCEACINGCGNATRCERTHYNIPNSSGDIIMARTRSRAFNASFRNSSSDAWSAAAPSTFPDVDANLNAGVLPTERVYMISNPCPDNGQGHGRDPLVLSSSANGWDWDRAVGVMSCEQLNQCGPRYPGRAKGPGPSYPQAVTVTAPQSVAGIYVVATNNKEDVVVSKVTVPWDQL